MSCNNMVKLLKVRENALVPSRATSGSAGLDLYACIDEDIVLEPGESRMVPTGIAISLPENLAAFIFSRSGLAVKHGISLCNTVGVVDSDYRGEVCVALYNYGKNAYKVEVNERIAQMVIMPVCNFEFELTDRLDETERNKKGFGSTGRK
mgnify:CR=1 FL=1